MPEMDGLETLRRIRRTHPRLPVVMFSTLTDQGAQVTCEALAAGASDYVAKPSNVGSVTEAIRRVSARADSEDSHALRRFRSRRDDP